jgi:type I restriction enzyme R subunit
MTSRIRSSSQQQRRAVAIGDFKDVLTDVLIEAQDAHNTIADQLLKDERFFCVMQKMVAKMAWQKFQQSRA